MRDTGWQREGESAFYGRTVGAFRLVAVDRGGWWLAVAESDEPTLAHGRLEDLDPNKRAAEDALRKLCRDTLAALGETP